MRILNTIRPNNNQRMVLAIILASPTPKIAAEQLTGNSNIVSARDTLAKIGAITFSLEQAALTDRGTQIAREENIVDDAGQLTAQGQQLLQQDTEQTPGNQEQSNDINLEGFSLLKEIFKR